MSRTSLGLDYLDHVFNAERSIFRLEQQPIYAADLDPRYWPDYEAWLRQEPRHVDETDAVWGDWVKQTRKLAARGVPLTRVRVIDDPPTDYQRWTAFTAAHLNNQNGEEILYVRRQDVDGLGASNKGCDWWLIDDRRLLVMHFDLDLWLRDLELETSRQPVGEARQLQDLLLGHSVGPQSVIGGSPSR